MTDYGNDGAGYLLPDGEVFTDELACALVFYPNKPEYRRALAGSLFYLTTWLAWEKDSEKRGKDAAAAWKLAYDKTLECIEMTTCLDDVTDAINNLKLNVQYNIDCFCENFSINPPPPDVTDVPPGSETPGEYGGVEITSEEQYRRAVCYAANAYVDKLKQQNEQLIGLLNIGAIGIGLIAAILAVIGSGGLLAIVEYGLAASVFAGLVNLGTYTFLSGVTAEFEAARTDIVEAIVCWQSLSAVIEAAIDEDAWNYFYQFADWGTAAASVRSGSINGENQPYGQSEDCDDMCPDTSFDIQFNFDTGLEDWGATSGVTYMVDDQNIRINVNGSSANAHIELGIDTLLSALSLDPGTILQFTSFQWIAYADGLTLPADTRCSIVGTGGGIYTGTSFEIPVGGSILVDFDATGWESDDGTETIWVTGIRNGASTGNFIRIDAVRIQGYYLT